MATKDIELKQQVLSMLKDFMMGEDGKKFAPKVKEVEVEVIAPVKSKGGLAEVLDEASKEPMEPEDEEIEEDEVEEKPSFKDFFKNKG